MAMATKPALPGVLEPRRVAALVAVLPGLLVILAGLLLSLLDGGFATDAWSPVALFLLALLVVVLVVAPPERGERSGLFEAAVATYAAFCAWNYLSILWADVPGDAWDGANRAVLYGLAIAIAGLRPWSRMAATVALGLAVAGTSLIAVGTLLVGAGDDTAKLFLEGRLAEPTGYANATADLWLIAFWPAVHLATVRTLSWPLRGLALAAATILVQTALLSQSRGAVVAFVVVAILYVVLAPRRWPSLLALLLPMALTAISWDVLVDVRTAATPAALGPALADAREVVFASALVSFVVGCAAALGGRRAAPSIVVRRDRLVRAGDLALAGIAVAGVVAVGIAIGNPATWLDDRWEDFKTSGYSRVDDGGTRFGGSLGSNRYDFYRVALNEFADHPVAGIGADNFAVPYLRHRRSDEAPRYPHSFAMRVLAGLGAVGTLLFLGFLALIVLAIHRGTRRATGVETGLAVAAGCGFSMWLVHGMVDWLWEFPTLGVLGFALLTVAARGETSAARLTAAEPREEPIVAPPSPLDSPVARAGFALTALVVALSLALPGISARFTDSAYEGFGGDPELALSRLERASSLDFLGDEALVAKGVIARRLGRTSEARAALQHALDRVPKDWFAHFELGLLEAEAGRSAAALDSISRARALNPRQPLIREVQARAERGQQLSATSVERRLYQQLGTKLRPTG